MDTFFLVYQPPFFRGQQGIVGHILGGWTFSPIFTAGSGAPDFCLTNAGNFGSEGYSGSQDFGSGDSLFDFTNANCVLTSNAGTSASVHNVGGIADMFANPQAVFNNVRPLVLGYDNNSGGFGQFRGLPYWNVNLGIKKNIRFTERFSAEASFNFINVLNHNQLLDPNLNIAGRAHKLLASFRRKELSRARSSLGFGSTSNFFRRVFQRLAAKRGGLGWPSVASSVSLS